MGFSNEKPVFRQRRMPQWKRTALMTGGCVLGTLVALSFYPPTLEAARSLLPQPISNAIASQNGKYLSPAEARKQHLSEAGTAVHGMYIKDPYGCVYMFQYVSASLSLIPVVSEHGKQVCE
ncbi:MULTISPECIES: hypothetical protein [Oxalobacteraceae]|jgi:hypothetical protein|uniref:hypothetical protein n=1 Tax=Oxalobacteraceae TaxID=75682 RepID=UPI0010A4047E|nr:MULTISPECIES: hypothetical protein [Oxalobacteraceae]